MPNGFNTILKQNIDEEIKFSYDSENLLQRLIVQFSVSVKGQLDFSGIQTFVKPSWVWTTEFLLRLRFTNACL